jgi:hypothetical protein
VLEAAILQGRKVGGSEIAQIQALIEANPQWSRWRLSQELAEKWDWYSASGQLKDMAARTLLLKLHERGLIALPERKRAPVVRRPRLGPDLFDALLPEPISADLSSLQPFQVQVVGPKQPDYHVFQRYLAQHHYLSFGGPIGENLGYLIRSRAGVDLACLLFGAAAWQCAPRDQWIGWSTEQRAQGLPLIANNSRVLILPWVRVAHLGGSMPIGKGVITTPFACWRPSSNRTDSEARATRRLTGFTWAKPPDGHARASAIATIRSMRP